MKIRLLRKQCIISLLCIIFSLPLELFFIKNNQWFLSIFYVFLFIVLVLIIIGYYQVIIFKDDRLILITNLINKKTILYNDVKLVYVANIILHKNKLVKRIILVKEENMLKRITYSELLLPIKKNSFINFKHSKNREIFIRKTFNNIEEIIVENYTGNIITKQEYK